MHNAAMTAAKAAQNLLWHRASSVSKARRLRVFLRGPCLAAGLALADASDLLETPRGPRGDLHLDLVDQLPQGQKPVDRAAALPLHAHAQVQGGVIKRDAVGGLVDLLPALAAAFDERLLDESDVDAQANDPAFKLGDLAGRYVAVLVEVHSSWPMAGSGRVSCEQNTARMNSRFMRAMLVSLISLGQTASHSASLEQLPKPSASICFCMARTRRSRSGWPCG